VVAEEEGEEEETLEMEEPEEPEAEKEEEMLEPEEPEEPEEPGEDEATRARAGCERSGSSGARARHVDDDSADLITGTPPVLCGA